MKLYIIGNGFDIAHKLPTNYWDFRKYLEYVDYGFLNAFEIYQDVKIVIFVHLYGVPGKIDECKKICEEHGALLIEDISWE